MLPRGLTGSRQRAQHLHGDVGYTFRARGNAQASDFNGPSGRLNYDYFLSGKTTLQASIYEIRGPTDSNFSTYIRTRGLSFGAQYQATVKMGLAGTIGYSQITYLGEALAPGARRQQYAYWTMGLNALYQATRVVSLNAALTYQWRTSALPFGDYEVLTGTLGVNAEF